VSALLVACLFAVQPAPVPEPAPPPAAPPSAVPAPSEPRASRAEVDALRAELARQAEALADLQAKQAATESEREASQTSGPQLDLYGYMDVAFFKAFGLEQGPGQAHQQRAYINDNGSFALGNLNLYLDVTDEERWRFLSEIRFTLAPHGSESERVAGVPFERTDNTTFEPGNPENQLFRWSAIVIERAQIEWMPRDWFKLTAGIFLTPYGIWNVDHGSPVVIPARVPYAVRQQLFPERQIGLQASGRLCPGDLTLG
jgi:hypothetical protein